MIQRRLVQPLKALLTQGITPEKIALSLAAGAVLGVFPVLGTTTLLCAAAAVVFRLNLPAIQLINYLVYPLQLLLLVPFIRAGEFLFRAQPAQISPAKMVALARADLPKAAATLWLAYVHAVTAWLLAGPLAILLLFVVLVYPMRRAAELLHGRNVPRNAGQGDEVNLCL